MRDPSLTLPSTLLSPRFLGSVYEFLLVFCRSCPLSILISIVCFHCLASHVRACLGSSMCLSFRSYLLRHSLSFSSLTASVKQQLLKHTHSRTNARTHARVQHEARVSARVSLTPLPPLLPHTLPPPHQRQQEQEPAPEPVDWTAATLASAPVHYWGTA